MGTFVDSLVSQSGTTLPGNPDNVFLVLEIEITKFFNVEWIGRNALLTCDGTEYYPARALVEFGGGILNAYKLIFEVLKDFEFNSCLVKFKDQSITLAPFFE